MTQEYREELDMACEEMAALIEKYSGLEPYDLIEKFIAIAKDEQ